jgi:hypothetical protein
MMSYILVFQNSWDASSPLGFSEWSPQPSQVEGQCGFER